MESNQINTSVSEPNFSKDAVMGQLDPDEKLIVLIRRHVFGILLIYVEAIAALAIAISLIYFLLPNFVDRSEETIYRIIGLVAGVIVIIMAIILVLAAIIYYSSKLILSDQNITQIIQAGLFNKKVSQLNVANIEDVNATKKGFFSTIFNFGILNIQTAGAAENFIFPYCPRPDHYAKIILEARDQARSRS